MKRINKKKIHIFYLVFIFFFSALPMFAGNETYTWDTFLVLFIIIILCSFCFYFFYLYLVPEFYFKNKTILFWIFTSVFLIANPFVWYLVFYLLSIIINYNFLSGNFLNSFLYGLLFSTFGGFFRFQIEWFKNKQEKQELENKNVKSELSLLRSQVNPHFLFNTLNNIHSYAHIDADITAYSIEKLSDIMRYMLYEANTEKVLLDREIDYINSYIELVNLKFADKKFVKFNITGETGGKKISPMLFIVFIENAYKHCKKRDISPGIIINLTAEKEKTAFSVQNHIGIKNTNELNRVGGLGLDNIKRRLELLYPEKHQMDITRNEDMYKVELIINE